MRQRRSRDRGRRAHWRSPKRAATEQRLFDATLRVLRKNGILAGLNMSEVAAEAGLSRGLIHHYFGSRRALVRAALESRALAAGPSVGRLLDLPLPERAAKVILDVARGAEWVTLFALLSIDDPANLDNLKGRLEFQRYRAVLLAEQAAGALIPGVDIDALSASTYALGVGWALVRADFAKQSGLDVASLDKRLSKAIGQLFSSFANGKARA